MKKKPLKIAFIADALDYQYAGIYYYTYEILHALARIDSFNQYYFVRSQSTGHISPNVQELVVPTKKIIGGAAYRLFVQIPKILTKLSVDIVVEPRHFGPFNLPKTIKRITFIHDLSPLHYPEWHPFMSQALQRLFLPSILKRADHILTNSEFTKQDIIEYFPVAANKITTTLLAKDELFHPRPNPSFIHSLGISQPYILSLGTIEPRKNLITLLKAFEIYKKQAKNAVKLVLVGKNGWKNAAFYKEFQQSSYKEDIHIIGYLERNDLVSIYSSATVFVYPSLFEGFGLPIVEAMACGCPVIASNAASLPEIGDSACLYFMPTSATELANQLDTVLSDIDRQAQMKALSIKQAAKFSWNHTAQKTLDVFESLRY